MLKGDTWGKSAEICIGDAPIAFINRKGLNVNNIVWDKDTVSKSMSIGGWGADNLVSRHCCAWCRPLPHRGVLHYV
jgi:hypothetical protein